MFKLIMVPVDLEHQESLGRALSCAADLARIHNSEVCYVGATTPAPSTLGRTPAEYEEKLSSFAEKQAGLFGHRTSHKVLISHDPTTDIDDVLLTSVKETGADLVVMATHKPGIGDYVWPSNGGRVAAHADASVFLVRG